MCKRITGCISLDPEPLTRLQACCHVSCSLTSCGWQNRRQFCLIVLSCLLLFHLHATEAVCCLRHQIHQLLLNMTHLSSNAVRAVYWLSVPLLCCLVLLFLCWCLVFLFLSCVTLRYHSLVVSPGFTIRFCSFQVTGATCCATLQTQQLLWKLPLKTLT